MDTARRYPNRIKSLREERHLSQQQVAFMVGLSESAVSRHEAGNRSLDGMTIDRYARTFHVPPHLIFLEPEKGYLDDVDAI